MAQTQDIYEQRFRAALAEQKKAYDEGIRRVKARNDRMRGITAARVEKQKELLRSIGVKTDFIDQDKETGARELKDFLAEALPPMAARPSVRAQETKEGTLRSEAATAAAHFVVPVYGAGILVDGPYLGDAPDTPDVAIDNGWVLPNNPSNIKIKAGGNGADVWCFEAVGGPASPQCSIVFTFTPDKTQSYDMTAIVAFHGFYVLVSDDGIFTCKSAMVQLDVKMDVKQYYDVGAKTYPSPLSVTETNVSEVVPWDFTKFFDNTVVLKGGDPVTVTLTITLTAQGIGSGTYAELDFSTGSANYIQPLFLSVGPS